MKNNKEKDIVVKEGDVVEFRYSRERSEYLLVASIWESSKFSGVKIQMNQEVKGDAHAFSTFSGVKIDNKRAQITSLNDEEIRELQSRQYSGMEVLTSVLMRVIAKDELPPGTKFSYSKE